MAKLTKLADDLYRWTDTCNVYVIRSGDSALLIDLGDGGVLDALGEIGVKSVEWVLFTHHHREQCQGAGRLKGTGAKVAVPAGERAFFEDPLSFRKMKPTLGDAHTVHGASYVRPPIRPIPVDRAFAKMDDFTWRGREFWCVQTAGNSPGHTAYLLRVDGRVIAFSGDLMLDGGKMHTWYDTEWDYGFAKGLFELAGSAAQLAGYDPVVLHPSHGPEIRDARKQLLAYVDRRCMCAAGMSTALRRPTRTPSASRVPCRTCGRCRNTSTSFADRNTGRTSTCCWGTTATPCLSIAACSTVRSSTAQSN